MNTCATCAYFEPYPHVISERVITSPAKTWIAAIDASSVVDDEYDGSCEMVRATNIYELWVDGVELPIRPVVAGSPARAGGDGCCHRLSVKSTFGCNAWEAKGDA
jgi:hypothetical protein